MLPPVAVVLAVVAAVASVDAAGTPEYKPNHHELRKLMSDSAFLSLTTPCVPAGEKRFVAAEWIRTAFHDAATYDASTGLGGIDGSLDFERTRPENAGNAIPKTLEQFFSFRMDGVSVADLTVLGAISSTFACGGPEIPFRYGRADTKVANAEGLLPLPTQPVHVHAGQFKRMGFNATEMIQLVACGHTLGGVHAEFHPELTNQPTAAFDSTRTVFDNAVAVEWINGSSIDPLARRDDPNNVGLRSDANIFSLDGNVTMTEYVAAVLASSKQAFNNACARVFSRLFDEAVPKGTVLSEPIVPYPVSIGFELRRRKETFQIRIGGVRVWGMQDKFKAIKLSYFQRDGTPANTSDWTVGAAPRIVMNGRLAVLDFQTVTAKPISPITGISAIKATVILNDDTEYVDKDGASLVPIDDTIAIDYDAAFTCVHTKTNPAAQGLFVTVGVLGGENQDVYIMTKRADGSPGARVKAIYRRPRANTPFSYYGIYIPDMAAFDGGRGISRFAGLVVRPTGESIDNYNGYWFTPGNQVLGCAATFVPPVDPVVIATTTTTTVAATSTKAVDATTTTKIPTASTATSAAPSTTVAATVATLATTVAPVVATTVAGDKPAVYATDIPSNTPADKPAYPHNSPATEPATEEPGVYVSGAVGLLSSVVGSVVSAALGWMVLF
ncbi:heme peroxidase [Entophlyctis helioformis]|nr:heme peroxidase [Entophlyctis helioformis]